MGEGARLRGVDVRLGLIRLVLRLIDLDARLQETDEPGDVVAIKGACP